MLLKGKNNQEIDPALCDGSSKVPVKDEDTDCQSLELNVCGYGHEDWLPIEIHVNHPKGSWNYRGCFLMLNEPARIARWFDAIADGKAAIDSQLDFIEPNLRFLLTSVNPVNIRVYFDDDCRPPWQKEDSEDEGSDEEPWIKRFRNLPWIDLEPSNDGLREAARSLMEQLQMVNNAIDSELEIWNKQRSEKSD